ALAGALGYDVRVVWGTAYGGAAGKETHAHSAVVARLGARDVLADVAYPLPVLLPLEPPACDIPTAWGKLSVARRDAEIAVIVDGQGAREERARLSPGDSAPLDEETRGDGLEPLLLRVLDDRVLLFASGELRVEDAWSRLAFPFPSGAADALRTLFAREDLTAEELAGVPAAPAEPARLTVFDRSELPATELIARLGTPAGLLALLAPGTRAEDLEEDASGWSWLLAGETGDPALRQRVTRLEDGVRVRELDAASALSERVYSVLPAGSGARLSLAATLAREVPPLGLGESVRKTLVFHLASELIALSRSS
ncbi:MAG TPA: hypothetical protein VKF32_01645, partial [Thermoanaerobaculia bacterium]|nr:hypothetical protein [Thermoanaerobaculia bacterium]